MNEIKELSYLVFESERFDAWRTFTTDFLGMMIADAGPDALKIRMDNHAYRFIVRRGGGECLAAAGFEVGSRDALERVRQRVAVAGVTVADASADELAERQVEAMIHFEDPEGLRLEVVYNPFVLSKPAELPLIPGGFVTGDQGFGHVAISAAEIEACEAFYRQVLGFRLSDYIVQDFQGIPIKFTFFHVNPRHHTLALAGLPTPKRLHHFMVEVRDLDVVGQALERAKLMDLPIHMAIGRHPNDRMVSFYVETPSDLNVEFGCDGIEIRDEDAWQIRTYDALSEWGHKF